MLIIILLLDMKINDTIELVTILTGILWANGQTQRNQKQSATLPQNVRVTIPPRCQPNPDLQFNQCCIFPPFYVRTVARDCGAMGRISEQDANYQLLAMRRTYNPGCDYYTCVLKKYQLLDSKDQLDFEKFEEHLKRWVELNSDFTKVIADAKAHCKALYRMYLPFDSCAYREFHKCMRQYVITSCPVPFKTPICVKLTNFYTMCKQYYIP